MECTCRGFKTPDVIRLCQKFRTHKLSDVAVELAELPCTFCNHPLSSHTRTPPGQDSAKASNSIFMNAMKPALGIYEGLALAGSSLMIFPPVNSECLELVLPLNFSDFFILLSVGIFKDSDVLMLAVASEPLNLTSHLNTGGWEEDKPLERGEIEVPGQNVKRRLKAKQAYSASVKRRSRRVASKKVREEQVKVLKQLKGLKGIASDQIPGGINDEVLNEETGQVEFTEVEHRQVLEVTTTFMKKIDVQDNYHTYCLPQVRHVLTEKGDVVKCS